MVELATHRLVPRQDQYLIDYFLTLKTLLMIISDHDNDKSMIHGHEHAKENWVNPNVGFVPLCIPFLNNNILTQSLNN